MIETSNVSKAHETGNKAIKNVSLTINNGEFVFIIGKSGSGRSTLMRLFLKELEPTRGRIIVNDTDLGRVPGGYIPEYRRRLGAALQDFRLLKDRTVLENVASIQRVIGVPARVIREAVPEMLRLVGLSSKYKAYPGQLSRGEQQRVTIVRTLTDDPEVLLANEPTGNLDSFNTHEIMRLLEEINRRGTIAIAAAHSQEMVNEMNKRIITMEQGSVIGDVGGCYQDVAPGALESLWICFSRRKGGRTAVRISTSWYCLRQGVINIYRNILFLLASIVTISTCILLFRLLFTLMTNAQDVAKTVEITMGITVFFDEDMSKEQILIAGDGTRGWEEARETRYIPAIQAQENLKTGYFEGVGELAEEFTDNNPLSGFASCGVFLNDIEEQNKIVERLEGTEGMRKIRYSSTAVTGLTSAGEMVGAMSAVIIYALLAVAAFLISNTVPVATAFRQRGNEIMRLVGAINYMIRAPFVMESMLPGTLGAAAPLADMYVLYQKAIIYIGEHYQMLTGMSEPIPLGDILPHIAAAAGCLDAGIGFFASYFIVHRHLKVQGKRM